VLFALQNGKKFIKNIFQTLDIVNNIIREKTTKLKVCTSRHLIPLLA
jgi:hypothetical protein